MTRRVALELIEIESPCEEDWASMRGDERIRHCDRCKQSVYDLSAIPRAEAEALFAVKQDKLCIRLTKRADGTVVTADCTPIRLALARKAARKSLALAAAMTGAIAAMLGGLGWVMQSEPLCATAIASSGVADRIAAAIDDKVERRHDQIQGRMPELQPRMGGPMMRIR